MDNEHDSNYWPCLTDSVTKIKWRSPLILQAPGIFLPTELPVWNKCRPGEYILSVESSGWGGLKIPATYSTLTAARSDPRHNLALGKPRAAPGTVRKITNNVATNCFVNIILRSGQPSVIAAHSSSSHHRSLLKTEEESYLALLLLFSFFKSP